MSKKKKSCSSWRERSEKYKIFKFEQKSTEVHLRRRNSYSQIWSKLFLMNQNVKLLLKMFFCGNKNGKWISYSLHTHRGKQFLPVLMSSPRRSLTGTETVGAAKNQSGDRIRLVQTQPLLPSFVMQSLCSLGLLLPT